MNGIKWILNGEEDAESLVFIVQFNESPLAWWIYLLCIPAAVSGTLIYLPRRWTRAFYHNLFYFMGMDFLPAVIGWHPTLTKGLIICRNPTGKRVFRNGLDYVQGNSARTYQH